MPFFLLSAIVAGLLSCSVPPSHQPDLQRTAPPSFPAEFLPLPHTVGVLPFDYHGHAENWSWLRHGLPDMLITDLVSRFGMKIISRDSLGEVLREQWLQHRGMSEAGQAVKLGRLSGARYLLKGSIYDIQKGVAVDVHMLDVERGSVIRTGRTVGSYDDLPALERQLSAQIQNWFPLRYVEKFSDPEDVPPLLRNETSQEPTDPHPVSDVSIELRPQKPPSYVSGLDLQLSFERNQRMREEAWYVASKAWETALSIEMSPPEFADGFLDSGSIARNEEVVIPVTSYFHSEDLNTLHPELELSFLATDQQNRGKGRLVWKGDASTSRLFAEQFRAPRRLFIRAIAESGQIIGVSSSWAWRADQAVHVHDSGIIDIAIWPTPIIHGQAVFMGDLLARDQAIKYFDAIMVLVPQERKSISVELIESAGVKAREHSMSSDAETSAVRFQRALTDWFEQHWTPPVSEFLPVHGYLPGNRRSIQLRVTGRHNTVMTAQIGQTGDEPHLLQNVKSLIGRLTQSCLFDCRNGSQDLEQHDPVEVRVQLDLHKDLQHVGLGETVSGIP
ncbi:MAG: CsgG/HfaB family protein [Nitrospirales bacterium]|nr:hypothetical protein [Nitrospira sp.]MDR4502380.1 CsgG/HfaB family protein [Nitrospirales bacterium]